MKKFAKLLAMVLAVSMVLTMFVGAVDYTDTKDVTKEQAAAIADVYEWGIMQGYNNAFRPADPVTRDEMAKIMYTLKMVGSDPNAIYGSFAGSFADAADMPKWSEKFVGYAAVEGIFIGNDKNEFNALGEVSYIEAAIVLLRALGEDNVDEDGVSEYAGATWYTSAVKDALANDLFANIDADDLKAAATRADIAVMIQNAVNKADEEDDFKLAALVEGVVLGEAENGDEEAIFVFDDETMPEVELGDLDVADYAGKKISAVVEDGDIQGDVVVADSVKYTVRVDEISFSNEDKKADTGIDGKEALKLGDTVVVKNIFDNVNFYFFPLSLTTGIQEADPGSLLVAALEAGLGQQEATFVISEGVVSAFFAPVVPFTLNPANIREDYDEDDGWLGTYTIDLSEEVEGNEFAIDAAYGELEDALDVMATVIDGELIVVGKPVEVDASKLVVTYSAKNGYSIKLDGKDAEIFGLSALTAADLYAAQGAGTLYVYGEWILAYEAAEIEEVEGDYVIILDKVTAKLSTDDGVIDAITLTMLTVDGEVKITVPADETINALELGVIYVTNESEDEDGNAVINFSDIVPLYTALVTAKDGDDITVAGIDGVIDAEDVDFVNLTDDAKLADIEITNGIIKVGGEKVKYDTVAAFWVVEGEGESAETKMVIVYDAEGEFGIYAEIIAAQDELAE